VEEGRDGAVDDLAKKFGRKPRNHVEGKRERKGDGGKR